MNYITFVILVGLGSLNIETTPDSHKYEDQKTKKKKKWEKIPLHNHIGPMNDGQTDEK